MKQHLRTGSIGIVLLVFLAGCIGGNPKVTGDKKTWHPVTLTFKGPAASETGEVNPFLDYKLTVIFKKGEKEYTVPGYFAADGKAGESSATEGNKWRVHFTPDEAGEWSWLARFRTGELVALNDSLEAGEAVAPDSTTGTLTIIPNDHKNDPGFFAKGRLEYTGEQVLRFAGSGEPFLKAGADSPENFLAYYEFDQTPPKHKYEPHARDWKEGDPTWKKGKGKNIIGALNYLASKGMNSVYFLTMNVYGDGKDVWPWIAPYERLHYDCSKLDQWEVVFSHMDRLGLMLHVVTQETENELLLDNGYTDIQRKLYYRELVARFGHHLAITWNLGEENGYANFTPNAQNDQMRKDMAAALKAIDPYDHFLVVHTHSAQEPRDVILNELLDDPNLDGPSLQIGNPKDVHRFTKQWVLASAQSERPWVCCLDEIGHHEAGVIPDADDPTHDIVRKYALWGNLIAGGGGCEWYFGYKYPHADLNCEDWRSRDKMWDLTRIAVQFFQTNLPFAGMTPADHLVSDRNSWCLAKEKDTFAVYLIEGGTAKLNLKGDRGLYRVQWFNPRKGGDMKVGTVFEIVGPGWRSLGYPPEERDQDWVVLVKRR